MDLTANQEKGLLDRLFRTPAGRRMKQEMEAEEAEQSARRAAIEELPKLRDERAEMIDRQMAEHDESVDAIREAQRTYYEALRAGQALGSRHHGEIFVLDTKIAKLELFLSQTAPKALKAQIDKLEEEIRQIQAEPFTSVLKDAWDASKAYVETDYQDKVARINGLYGKIEALKREIMTGGVQ